jgi:hypothetical protein
MDATAWKGATYGIRVGKENARKYFKVGWHEAEVEIDGEFHVFSLSHAFWQDCPEIRGNIIEKYLAKNGLVPWSKGAPPKFTLSSLGANRFRLSLVASSTTSGE